MLLHLSSSPGKYTNKMTKQVIIKMLLENHQKFTAYVSLLNDREFDFSLQNEKWTAGQQADHINRSISPLNLALRLPKWLIKLLFGKANRPSKNYEELVKKYLKNWRVEAGHQDVLFRKK
ncbi:MAG: hypothetical protein ABR503_00500 [Chitinophagaceae bacterium]